MKKDPGRKTFRPNFSPLTPDPPPKKKNTWTKLIFCFTSVSSRSFTLKPLILSGFDFYGWCEVGILFNGFLYGDLQSQHHQQSTLRKLFHVFPLLLTQSTSDASCGCFSTPSSSPILCGYQLVSYNSQFSYYPELAHTPQVKGSVPPNSGCHNFFSTWLQIGSSHNPPPLWFDNLLE